MEKLISKGTACMSRPYVIVVLNIILEVAMVILGLFLAQTTGGVLLLDVQTIFLGITTIFLILSIFWIFTMRKQMCFARYRMIKAVQASVMIASGGLLLLCLILDKTLQTCRLVTGEQSSPCQQFEIRVIMALLAKINGFLYLARRPILQKFVVEMEDEDSHFHRRYLGDGEDYLKDFKRDSRGSILFDVDGRKLYASYPQLDDYIVKVDVLPPGIRTPTILHCSKPPPAAPPPMMEALAEVHAPPLPSAPALEPSLTKEFYPEKRASFYLSQEYFLPNFPRPSKDSGCGSQEESRYSTLTRDGRGFTGFE